MTIQRVTIGDCTLLLGDCLSILPTLPAGCVDAVVTDPPYGVEGGHGGQTADYLKADYCGEWTDNPQYIRNVCAPAIRLAIDIAQTVAFTPGTRCLWEYPPADDIGCFWSPAAPRRGRFGFAVFHPILYYGKNWLSGVGQSPAGIVMNESAEPNGHPCPKPIEAWTWLTTKMTPPGGVCLDPFMGSGTTLVAAVRTGRRAIGIEIEPRYFDIAVRRVESAYRERELFQPVPPRVVEQVELFPMGGSV